jgi:outer membrane protein W
MKIMKKLYSFLLITSIALSGFGQNEKGVTLETQFDIFSKSGKITPNLKGRYFFNSNNALRITLAVDYSDKTEELFEVDGEGVGSIQTTNSFSTIGLGYEKHFSDSKVSPYIGGEFKMGFGGNSVYGSRTDSLVFVNDFNYSSDQKINAFGVHLFTGVDIHLYKGLYCGTEIGFQFNSVKHKRGEYNTEDASSTTDATTSLSIPEKKSKDFTLVNMGVLRIGWHF